MCNTQRHLPQNIAVFRRFPHQAPKAAHFSFQELCLPMGMTSTMASTHFCRLAVISSSAVPSSGYVLEGNHH